MPSAFVSTKFSKQSSYVHTFPLAMIVMWGRADFIVFIWSRWAAPSRAPVRQRDREKRECVSVCVCERERERKDKIERKKRREGKRDRKRDGGGMNGRSKYRQKTANNTVNLLLFRVSDSEL